MRRRGGFQLTERPDAGAAAAGVDREATGFPAREGGRGGGAEGGRRHLTVMFCDLVASTAMAEGLDPEVVHEILLRYQEACADVITRYDGHIAQYLGDGLLVYFGHPRAHEDDARRAALAALEMIESVKELGETISRAHGFGLSMRVGVHTGLVVLGDIGAGSWRQSDYVVGETPNVAARVQAIAEPNSALITAATYELVQGYVEVVPLGPQQLKGVSKPMELFRVVAPTGAVGRLEAMPWRRSQVVGRTEERRALEAAWSDVAVGGFRAVLIEGEAGIGKSRLLECLRDRVGAEATQLYFQCSPYRTSSVLYPVLRTLERDAGIGADDDNVSRWTKLQSLLGAGDEDEDDVSIMAELLSIPVPPGAARAELSGEERRERGFQVLRSWVERAAKNSPVLLLFEDMHWADPSTNEFLSRLFAVPPARTMPVMTSRPAAHQLPLGAVTVLRLGVLGRDDRLRMIESLTAGRTVPAEARSLIVERSDGVPLFIEELALVSSAVPRTAGRLASEPEIPSPLQELLTARLDGLPEHLYLTQVVATLGQPAPLSLLQRLVAAEEVRLKESLQALLTAGILVADVREGTEPNYSIRHLLLRDAAYQRLLRSRRRDLHSRIGHVLESQFPEQGERHPEILAHHFEQAGEYRRAAEYWHRAGLAAAALAAHAEAIEYQRRALSALDQLPEGQCPPELELAVRIAIGPSLLALHGYTSPDAAISYQRALELSSQAHIRPNVQTMYGLWAYYLVRSENDVALDLARRTLELARASTDPDEVQDASTMLGYQLFFAGELEQARTLLEQGAASTSTRSVPAMPQDPTTACLVNLAPLRWMLGYPDQARQALAAAITQSARVPPAIGPFTRAYMHNFAAWYLQMSGDTAGAADHARRAIDISQPRNFVNWLVSGHLHLAIAGASMGMAAEVIPPLAGGITMWRLGGAELFCSYWLASLAGAHRQIGELEAARAAVEEAVAHAQQRGERFHEAELYRLRGELLAEAEPGRRAEAAAEIRRAVDVARRQKARMLELRAATSLHRLLAAAGPSPETAELLRDLISWFTEGLDEPDLVQARAALEGVRR